MASQRMIVLGLYGEIKPMYKTVLIISITVIPMGFIIIDPISKLINQSTIVTSLVLAIVEVALVILAFVVISSGKLH